MTIFGIAVIFAASAIISLKFRDHLIAQAQIEQRLADLY
jgi:hypothetical protein